MNNQELDDGRSEAAFINICFMNLVRFSSQRKLKEWKVVLDSV